MTTPQTPVFSSAAAPSPIVVDTTSTIGTSIASISPSDVISIPPQVVTSSVNNPVTSVPPPTTHIITSVLPATTDAAGNTQAQTILVTSTAAAPVFPTVAIPATSSSKTTSTSSGSGVLASSASNASTTSGGLSAGGKIAVAVVVPVVAVALIVIAALFLWRKRKQRKEAEELRRKEVEEYGFNPNNDPTLPVVGGASSVGDDPSEMRETDGVGYRGWGTTTTTSARKPSTTLSSGAGAIGVARSTSGSDNGRYTNSSPTGGTNKSSDVQSGDPLVGSPSNGRPLSDDSETIGALGAVPSNGNRQDIHRGPSNASSAYSGAHRSDTSGEGAIPGGAPGQQYYNDGMYYDEGMPQHGPYGDGSYGGGQPVIRDVQARRNTRIENPSVIPQQGNAGIAQNF